jgi:hypothetical protein
MGKFSGKGKDLYGEYTFHASINRSIGGRKKLM